MSSKKKNVLSALKEMDLIPQDWGANLEDDLEPVPFLYDKFALSLKLVKNYDFFP